MASRNGPFGLRSIRMTSKISSVTQPPGAPPHAANKAAAAKSRDISISPDAVVAKTAATISSAAQAALQEATETPAQTAKESRGNDHQAQRLLAKENAAKEAATKA